MERGTLLILHYLREHMHSSITIQAFFYVPAQNMKQSLPKKNIKRRQSRKEETKRRAKTKLHRSVQTK